MNAGAECFELPAGQHRVTVYFPWSAQTVVSEVHLSDGASIIPVEKNLKMLCFGDSITHGYDALYPSDKYITKIARMLDAQEYNKAIGGEIFFPKLPTMVNVVTKNNKLSNPNFDVLFFFSFNIYSFIHHS